MTSKLPPQVAPHTPREPKLPKPPEGSSRGNRPDSPRHRGAPPREFMMARRGFSKSFMRIREEWTNGTLSDLELEAYRLLANTAEALADGLIGGQEIIDKLS